MHPSLAIWVHFIFADVSVGEKHLGDKLSHKSTDLLSKCFAPAPVRCTQRSPPGALSLCTPLFTIPDLLVSLPVQLVEDLPVQLVDSFPYQLIEDLPS